MSNAYSCLDTREWGPFSIELLSDFSYRDKIFGSITAKKGFFTDYATLEPLRNILLFWLFALLSGYGNKSAAIHDWLYDGNGIPRDDGSIYKPTRTECDGIFYRGLLDEGVVRWRAILFYLGVRAFGWTRFGKRKKKHVK